MATTGRAKVSERGQLSLPAQARRRWGIEAGGDVGWLDVGSALVFVPGGVEGVRAAVFGDISAEVWREAGAGFGDPDLADQ